MRKFSPLRLMTSHSHLYAKLEEFGKDYNVATTNRVADECQYLNMHHRPTAPLARIRRWIQLRVLLHKKK